MFVDEMNITKDTENKNSKRLKDELECSEKLEERANHQ